MLKLIFKDPFSFSLVSRELTQHPNNNAFRAGISFEDVDSTL